MQQAKQNSIHVKEEKSGKSVNFSINNSITSSSSQDKVVVSNGADSNKATPVRLTASTQVVLQQAIDEARAADQKTIQELAKEVKRLTSLLPRQLIDEAEEEENNNTKESNKMEASEQVESSELDGDENSKSLNIITADDDGVVETEIGQRKQVSETEEASLKLVKGGESFCYKLLKIVTFTAIALLVLFIVILKFVA